MLSLHIAGVLFLRLKLLVAFVCKDRDVVLTWKAQHCSYCCYLYITWFATSNAYSPSGVLKFVTVFNQETV